MQEMWFYADTGRKAVGPCTRAALMALRDSSRIQPDTLVWKVGAEAWAPYAHTELATAPVPPPLPETSSLPELSDVADAVPESVAVCGAPTTAAPSSTVAEVAPVLAVDADYGVPSPRSFRGGAIRPAGASEPPGQPIDDDGWQYARPVMWRRYFARMLDTIMLGSLIWFVLATFFAAFVPGAYEALYGRVSLLNNAVSKSILVFVVVIPVEAWILGTTGTTAGKWLFGVRVTHADGRAIGFLRALRREGRVFLQGLALGIPLFSLIAMIVAFVRLKDDGASGWDAGKPWLVTARPPGVAQTWMFIAGVVCVIAAFVGLQALVAASKG
jgi:hypothetical protein